MNKDHHSRIAKPLPPLSVIQERFDYRDGELIHKQGFRKGRKAGSVVDCRGKPRVNISMKDTPGRQFLRSRLIWKLMTGSDPERCVDHIDGNSLNDRIENLRDIPHGINTRRKRLSSRNTSGITGVFRHRGKWQSCIIHEGKYIYLGIYADIEEAGKARKEAERKLWGV